MRQADQCSPCRGETSNKWMLVCSVCVKAAVTEAGLTPKVAACTVVDMTKARIAAQEVMVDEDATILIR